MGDQEQYARDKRITLVYKNEIDPTAFETVTMGGRSIDDYESICYKMGRCDSGHVCLHRKEGEEMKVTTVEMTRNFGSVNRKVLHRLVGVSYMPEVWLNGASEGHKG